MADTTKIINDLTAINTDINKLIAREQQVVNAIPVVEAILQATGSKDTSAIDAKLDELSKDLTSAITAEGKIVTFNNAVISALQGAATPAQKAALQGFAKK